MVGKATLLRSADRVANYVQQYVILAGADKRDEVLQLFDSILQLFPHWVISTCPMMHPDINYMSSNSSHVFGYSSEYLVRHASPEKYFTHIHEADQQDLFECFSYMHDFLESVPSGEHPCYRAVFHYRFRKANGQFMYLHDEKATLYLNGSGNLYYALFRDITSEKTFNGVKVEIFMKEQGGLIKVKEHKPSAKRNLLSKREGELVTLIKQGLSTKEIAWHLNISHNTVRNIKSNLFEKYNVNNTIELLNMTG